MTGIKAFIGQEVATLNTEYTGEKEYTVTFVATAGTTKFEL